MGYAARATEDASAGRWSARAPQRAEMHTRQWVGTYAGKGNGDYRGELASARRPITAYLKHFAFLPEMALIRLDGAACAMRPSSLNCFWPAHLAFRDGEDICSWSIPRGSRVLAHAPTASMARMNSGVVVELFESGWLELGEDLSPVRVIVARHPAPPKRRRAFRWASASGSGSMNCSSRRWMPRGSWWRMCSISIMGVEQALRCWPMKTSKKIPIAGVPKPSVGKSCGKLRVNGCGTCVSRL